MFTSTSNRFFFQSKPRLRYKTPLFLDFLHMDIDDSRAGQEFSYMARISGSTGSGKSTLADILFALHLKINPERYVVTYRGDEHKIKLYNQISPPYMRKKFFVVDHVVEIDELIPGKAPYQFIFYVDEAGLDASAKEALKKEMRPVVKMGKKSRHYKAIIIMLDQAKSVLKDYRALCHFNFYKRIGDEYIEEYSDWFANKYQSQLMYLEDWQVGFRSNYKYFRYYQSSQENKPFIKNGLLSLKMEDHIPWLLPYIEKSSQYLQNESVDHDYAVQEKTNKRREKMTKLVYNKFGSNLKKAKMKNIMTAWLKKEYPKEAYILQGEMNDIYNDALLIAYEKKEGELLHEEEMNATIQETQTKGTILLTQGTPLHSYAKQIYLDKGQKQEAGIVEDILKFYSQSDVAKNHGWSEGKLNTWWKSQRETIVGTEILENWCGLEFGLIIFGGNKSELDAMDPEGRLFTIKSRWGRLRNQLNYTKYTPGKEGDFNPANVIANFYQVNFGLIHFNVAWKDQALKIVKLAPFPSKGNNNLVLTRSDPCVDLTEIDPVPELAQMLKDHGKEYVRQHLNKIIMTYQIDLQVK